MATIIFVGLFVVAFCAVMFIIAIAPVWIEIQNERAVKRASEKYAKKFGGQDGR